MSELSSEIANMETAPAAPPPTTLLEDLTASVPRVRNTPAYRLAAGSAEIAKGLLANATKAAYQSALAVAQAASNLTGKARSGFAMMNMYL